jgi:hypothetical protein
MCVYYIFGQSRTKGKTNGGVNNILFLCGYDMKIGEQPLIERIWDRDWFFLFFKLPVSTRFVYVATLVGTILPFSP